ncbi:MAG: DUF4197 domain-containing protein [Rhodocyclaceae bacterium]|nr:DUF4197 domain-containing protein [Rhodocyclaceae bacterium]
MMIRKWPQGVLLVFLWVAAGTQAFSLPDISAREASGGLKEALTQGTLRAVNLLGRTDGFLAHERVKIMLPPGLREAEGLLRGMGLGRQVDELQVSMNRAAEAAVPEARALLMKAIQEMTVDDARTILMGGEDAGAQYFKRQTKDQLLQRFLPLVRRAMEKVRLAQTYERFAAKAATLGLIKEKDAQLDAYIAEKTLEGLYRMIAEEERAIRQDPAGASGKMARRVFGLLR